MIGWCHYQLGHYDEAQRLYLSALELDEDDPGTQFDLALVLMRMGHYDLALREYRRGLGMLRKVERPRQRGLLFVAVVDLKEGLEEDSAARDRQEIHQALNELIESAITAGLPSTALDRPPTLHGPRAA